LDKAEHLKHKQTRGSEAANQTPGEEASAHDTPKFAPGQIVADRYRIIRLLGQGGMGKVYEVENVFLQKRFALKVLGSQKETALRRFQQEAKAASRLDHPSLIKVQDFGLLDGAQPFLIMDLVTGVTLSEVIKRAPLTFNEATHVFKQICWGLSYAHRQDLIHRDVKPSNIIISDATDLEHAAVMIIDFGIAKVNSQAIEANALTRTGELIGTPFYMSPEQCMGTAIDPSSDVYSVGCMLFECLTGLPPFLGDSPLSTMLKHQSEAPPTLEQATLGSKFPDGLQLVLDKLLSKKPADRYSNLNDLAIDLDRIKSGDQPLLGARSEDRRQVRWNAMSVGICIAMAVFCVLYTALLTSFSHTGHSVVHLDQPMRQSSIWAKVEERMSVATTKRLPDRYAVSTGDTGTNQKFSPTAQSHTPFSSRLPGQPTSRLFQFPDGRGEIMGELTALGPDPRIFLSRDGNFVPLELQTTEAHTFSDVVNARGTMIIQNFKGLKIIPTQFLCDHPELLSRFRADEIREFQIDGVMCGWSDGGLHSLTSLTDLTVLKLDKVVTLNDKALNTISSFHKLSELWLEQGTITRVGLAKCFALRNVRSLKLMDYKDTNTALRTIGGSPHTEYLTLERCDLNRESVLQISKLPNLSVLDINNDGRLTNADLAPLSQCRRLKLLRLDCKLITPEIAQTLKLLNLDRLDIRMDASGRAELAHRLHPCIVSEFKGSSQINDRDLIQRHFLHTIE